MSKYKVGDNVRILHSDYHGCGLDVGSVHMVAGIPIDGVTELKATYANGRYACYAFHDFELEPYTDAEDHTAKIARLVRELNSALAESKDNLEVSVDIYCSDALRLVPIISVDKKERIA